jgi:hypothetical protein
MSTWFARSTALGGAAALALSLPVALGCGAAPPELHDGTYRSGSIAFKVGAVPAGWRAVNVEGANLAYRDEANEASVMVDGRCYRKDDDVPLLALTDHLIMGTTERRVVTQETLPFDGREAMHTRLEAKLDGVALLYDVYVLKKDGCVYDLVLVGAPQKSEPALPPFEGFAGAFHTLAGAGAGS